METRKQSVPVPVLSIDTEIAALKGFNDGRDHVSTRGRIERRVVANWLHHMESAGLRIVGVHDLESETRMKSRSVEGRVREAMELIFNLDMANVHFALGARKYCACLVLGNGTDVISDWFSDGAEFDAAMGSFDAEEYC